MLRKEHFLSKVMTYLFYKIRKTYSDVMLKVNVHVNLHNKLICYWLFFLMGKHLFLK